MVGFDSTNRPQRACGLTNGRAALGGVQAAFQVGSVVNLQFLGRRTRETPRRILVTRLSAIGDCILTIPLVVAAKRLWPESHITWIVDCAAEQLLRDHPCVDEVLKIEKRWLKRPSNWSHLRNELRARNFDLALDPQGLSKSAMLGWMSGARRRIGFDFSHGREVAPLLATTRLQRTNRHMVDTYLQLLSPWMPVIPGTGEFAMPVYTSAAERAEAMLRELGLGDPTAPTKWLAINPGAGWTTRQWPVERFGRLAKQLWEQHARPTLVFWAGQQELLLAQVIAEESRGAARVAPATSLCELLELVRRTSLLITGDTGPLHMASALGTPCVSLHGPTWADESGPYRNRHVAIQSPAPRLNNKLVRSGPNTAMQAIEVEEVLAACSRLLATETSAVPQRLVA